MEESLISSINIDEKYDIKLADAYAAKLELRGAYEYALSLLLNDNLVTQESPVTVTPSIMEIGKEIHRLIVKMTKEKKIIIDDELIDIGELNEENEFHEVEGNISEDEDSDGEDEDYVLSEEKRDQYDLVPLELKMRAVRLAREHPNWSIQTLRKIKGCHQLKRKSDLIKWKRQVESGGTVYGKYLIIDSLTYARFKEARKNHQLISNNEKSKRMGFGCRGSI